MSRRPLRLLLTALALGSAACRERGARPAASNRILDSLLPGVEIGHLAAPIAERYRLPVVPSVGFGDSAIAIPGGVKGLMLVVDPPLTTREAGPGRWARVDRVALTLPIASLPPLVQAVSARLGPAERWCYRGGADRLPYDLYYWPVKGPRGILLSHPAGQPAVVVATWNGPRPDTSHLDRRACPPRPAE